MSVTDCEGTLKDSESNIASPTYYTNGENYSFTICPPNAVTIVITFLEFETEPINDYLRIFNGPDTNSPLLAGPFSGLNLPPQIIANGCITINFISDINVTAEGFTLSWEAQITAPQPPNITLPITPTCSTDIIIIDLDQNIHCDSVYTANITLTGQLNQTVNAIPLNCINDSTNTIQLSISPGFNESGTYDLFFETYFRDPCDSVWILSSTYQFIINDCPLIVDLSVNNDTICLGDCADLFVNVSGGDASTYTYSWTPGWTNSPGPWTVCPVVTSTYIVTVDDNGPATAQSDTVTIVVNSPPATQPNFSICSTDPGVPLNGNPIGGWWYGPSITNGTNPLFSPLGLPPGVHTVTYDVDGCTDDLDITILEVNAGPDISACLNAPIFNLNSSITTPGGSWWSGCNCIQPNGDIDVGGLPTTITAIYTLPNGCVDTLLVNVGGISTQPDDSLCQNSGNYTLTFNPGNGIWYVPEDTIQVPSTCSNPINVFPYQQNFEISGIGNWVHDPANDFDWVVHNGGTPSGGTGPSSAFEGFYYIYTEASNNNHPGKRAGIISPCLNLSAYFNPVLHFWYHKEGSGQGSFAVDVSVDDGVSWVWNHWYIHGDMGNLWQEAAVDLSMFNSSEVRIRLRVITGDGINGPGWQSDVAVDKLSILGGPITVEGQFLSDVANSGVHNLTYSIQGCEDYVDIYVNEIDAGLDQVACPTQSPFDLLGSPSGGTWSGSNITNISQGTFDPSLSIGMNFATYSVAGCIDTTEVWVIDTDVQIDSLFFCLNSGVQYLDMSIAPRIPWNGVWSGTGIINSGNSTEFHPILAGVGTHLLTYTANTCSDYLVVTVYPRSVLSDTLICSSSSDIILDVSPAGGNWVGNGIINSSTGLFSPSQLGVGIHDIGYVSPNGCIDTFSIEIYASANVSMSGLDDYYCFIDSNIQLNLIPAGGILSGNGVVGNSFNPSIAGTGYHLISYSYGTGTCEQVVDTIVFVDEQLIGATYQTDDTICTGNIVKIGASASGGIGNYSFNWDNGLSSSFEHLVEPNGTITYQVIISDGCSEDFIGNINVFVESSFNIDFVTSSKTCYGEEGFAQVICFPVGDYSYNWSTSPSQITDTVFGPVNRNYQVQVLNNITGCIVEGTIRIPGYDILQASFFPNQSGCLSLIDAEIQLIDNSNINANELSSSSFWVFGNDTISYTYGTNPDYTFVDTGNFVVSLYLVNNGGCIDSFSTTICVEAETKIHIPNAFTPNYDNCNDEFFARGIGLFSSFNISIYTRWGSEPIFQSDKISLHTGIVNNSCESLSTNESFYKMGAWDGNVVNGDPAPIGVYVYIIEYRQLITDDPEVKTGLITLIR
ncbi:MAG: gliding motility-associated C-terminal domain-containing protein [Bacteroidota bacterium]|nr:gliding motility-associated C-terminal domain-containing protein [Bacteroidota bacterium]